MACTCCPQVLWDGFGASVPIGQTSDILDMSGLAPPLSPSWYYEIWIWGLNEGSVQARLLLNDSGASAGPSQPLSNSPAMLRVGPQVRRLRLSNPGTNTTAILPYILLLRRQAL